VSGAAGVASANARLHLFGRNNQAKVTRQTMTLTKRVQALEDIEAIKRLKYDYFFFCDTKQPEHVRDCFVDGPVHIDYGAVGVFDHRDKLIAVFTELACHDHMVEMHHAQNPRIDLVDTSRAMGSWGLYYYLIDTRENSVTQLGAHYEDEYRKVDGNWLISATVCKVNSTYRCDLSEHVAKVLFAGSTSPLQAKLSR
jgi:hypothetical protein